MQIRSLGIVAACSVALLAGCTAGSADPAPSASASSSSDSPAAAFTPPADTGHGSTGHLFRLACSLNAARDTLASATASPSDDPSDPSSPTAPAGALGEASRAGQATGHLLRAVAGQLEEDDPAMEEVVEDAGLDSLGETISDAALRGHTSDAEEAGEELAGLCAGVEPLRLSARTYAVEGCALVTRLATTHDEVDDYGINDTATHESAAASSLLGAAEAADPAAYAGWADAATDWSLAQADQNQRNHDRALSVLRLRCGSL